MQPKNPLNLGRENNRDGCTRKGDMIILEKADQLRCILLASAPLIDKERT